MHPGSVVLLYTLVVLRYIVKCSAEVLLCVMYGGLSVACCVVFPGTTTVQCHLFVMWYRCLYSGSVMLCYVLCSYYCLYKYIHPDSVMLCCVLCWCYCVYKCISDSVMLCYVG